MFCPMKFNHEKNITGDVKDFNFNCNKENCAWWLFDNDTKWSGCAILSGSLDLIEIKSALNDIKRK